MRDLVTIPSFFFSYTVSYTGENLEGGPLLSVGGRMKLTGVDLSPDNFSRFDGVRVFLPLNLITVCRDY